MKHIKEFMYWINEREKVRLRKENGLTPPWSNDPVFQTTYFCNVNRENDKVTKWIRKNWSQGYPKENYTLAMIAARLFNRPETLGYLGYPDPWNPRDWYEKLATLQSNEEKIWGGAYIVTTHGLPVSKIEYAIRILNDAYEKAPIFTFSTLEHYHRCLMALEGLGSFMAAQVVADLKNTPNHPLQKATDWWTFAAPGPGSIRGLAWVMGRKTPTSEFNTHLENIAREVIPCVHTDICAQDLQNCLCEFDKYMRVKTGTGKSKRKYAGMQPARA